MAFHRFLAAPLALLLLSSCVDSSDTDEDEDAVTTRFGVDYSFARPSPKSIKDAGYTFVARYLSHVPAKDITKTEANALIAEGLDVVLNWEESSTAALSGRSQGIADAKAAEAEAVAVGQPAGRPIYFSIDFDATPGQQAVINDYFEGVASVIGLSRTGAYGGYYPIKRLFDAGKISWGWQAYAWSGGQWDSRAQFRQIENGIANDQEDKDEAIKADFGQWGHAAAPPETGPAPSAPDEPTACGEIAEGHGLARGKSVKSCDGRFDLEMQTDGNLVLRSFGTALWSSGTAGKGGDVAVMQDDGNFVVYDTHSKAKFSTHSSGHDGSHLSIQGDGNLVVYTGTKVEWTSDTGGIPPKPSACGVIMDNHGLSVGESIKSCDGTHELILQSDGNLVLYHGTKALWNSHTEGSGARFLSMQGDGNLVVYTQAGTAEWNSHTAGKAGSTLSVQDDGNVVIYHGTTAVWDTATHGK